MPPGVCYDAAGGVPAAGVPAGAESARVTEDFEQSQPLGPIRRDIFEPSFAGFSRQRHRDRLRERGLTQWCRVSRREYDLGAGGSLAMRARVACEVLKTSPKGDLKTFTRRSLRFI